jgi:hypothetical protein
MVHLDPRADRKLSDWQCRIDGASGGRFHHSDHCWCRQHGGKPRIVVRDGPFAPDSSFELSREAWCKARAL